MLRFPPHPRPAQRPHGNTGRAEVRRRHNPFAQHAVPVTRKRPTPVSRTLSPAASLSPVRAGAAAPSIIPPPPCRRKTTPIRTVNPISPAGSPDGQPRDRTACQSSTAPDARNSSPAPAWRRPRTAADSGLQHPERDHYDADQPEPPASGAQGPDDAGRQWIRGLCHGAFCSKCGRLTRDRERVL